MDPDGPEPISENERKDIILGWALSSDNEMVRNAVEQLMMVAQLAHGEEISAEISELEQQRKDEYERRRYAAQKRAEQRTLELYEILKKRMEKAEKPGWKRNNSWLDDELSRLDDAWYWKK